MPCRVGAFACRGYLSGVHAFAPRSGLTSRTYGWYTSEFGTRVRYFCFFAVASTTAAWRARELLPRLQVGSPLPGRLDAYYTFALNFTIGYWTLVLALLQVSALRRHIRTVRRWLAAIAALSTLVIGLASNNAEFDFRAYLFIFLAGPGLAVWSATTIEHRESDARADRERREAEALAETRHAQLLAAVADRPTAPARRGLPILAWCGVVAVAAIAARGRRR